MNHQKLEKEILKRLKGPQKKGHLAARYVGAQGLPGRKPDEVSRLTFLGHSVPQQKEVASEVWSLEEDLKTWIQLYKKTKYYEVKSIALSGLISKKHRHQRLLKLKSSEFHSWVHEVDNWAISDSLSDAYAFLLEKNPKLFSVYKKWNRSKNPWVRRQSLVGIYCYARMRKKPLPPKQVLPLVKNLLKDPHVYVQKGVGWTLREIYSIDSKLQIQFVQKHLKEISSVAWFATSEFYSLELKKQLVLERKRLRKGN